MRFYIIKLQNRMRFKTQLYTNEHILQLRALFFFFFSFRGIKLFKSGYLLLIIIFFNN